MGWLLAVCYIIPQLFAFTFALRAGGAGGALQFRGGSGLSRSQAIRSNVFSPDKFSDGAAVSFWYRGMLPVTSLEQNTLSFSGGAYFSFYDIAAKAPLLTCFDYASGRCLCGKEILVFDREFRATLEWQHFTLSVNSSMLMVGVDIGLPTEAISFHETSECTKGLLERFRSSVFVIIGSGKLQDQDLNGEMDDFCLLNHSISVAEASAIRHAGCQYHLPRAALNYMFDKPEQILYESSRKVEVGSSSNVVECEDQRVAYSYSTGFEPGPFWVISTAPVQAGNDYYVRNGDLLNHTQIEIACYPECAYATLVTATRDGLLCAPEAYIILNGTNTDIPEPMASCESGYHAIFEGAAVNMSGSTKLILSYAPFNVSTSGSKDTFYTQFHGINDTSVFANYTVLSNTPPSIAKNSSLEIPLGGSFFLMIPADITIYDIDGPTSELTSELLWTEGHSSIKMYDCSSCDENFSQDYGEASYDDEEEMLEILNHEVTQFPWVVKSTFRGVVLVVDADAPQNASLTIFYRLWDGYHYSNIASIAVILKKMNRTPNAVNETHIELFEDTSTKVDFSRLGFDLEGDDLVFEITQLPQHGLLYQVSSSFEERIVSNTDRESATLSQWVKAHVNNQASSCWDSTWCVNATVGAPQTYPQAGDINPSWQPDVFGVGIETWVSVEFEQAVFATSILVYEVWSPGGVVKIDILPDGESEWMTVWTGEQRMASFCPEQPHARACSGVSEYKLCPQSVRTSTVRLWLVADNEERWLGIDAILLNGIEQPQSTFILRDSNSRPSLVFKPDPDYYGEDLFKFSVSDCAYFKTNQRLHGPSSRHGSVQIYTKATPDRVMLMAWSDNHKVAPGSSNNLIVEVSDSDGFDPENIHSLNIYVSTSSLGVLSFNGTDIVAPITAVEAIPNTRDTKVNIELQFQANECSSQGLFYFDFEIEVRDFVTVVRQNYTIRINCKEYTDSEELLVTASITFLVGVAFLFLLTRYLALLYPSLGWLIKKLFADLSLLLMAVVFELTDIVSDWLVAFELWNNHEVQESFARGYTVICSLILIVTIFSLFQYTKLFLGMIQETKVSIQSSADIRVLVMRRVASKMYHEIQRGVISILVFVIQDFPVLMANFILMSEVPSIQTPIFFLSTALSLVRLGSAAQKLITLLHARARYHESLDMLKSADCLPDEGAQTTSGSVRPRRKMLAEWSGFIKPPPVLYRGPTTPHGRFVELLISELNQVGEETQVNAHRSGKIDALRLTQPIHVRSSVGKEMEASRSKTMIGSSRRFSSLG